MATVDLNGVALVIGAFAGLVTVIGTLILQILTFVRAGQMRVAVTELHDSVNGQSVAFKEALEKVAFAAGEKSGVQSERAAPMVPKSTAP